MTSPHDVVVTIKVKIDGKKLRSVRIVGTVSDLHTGASLLSAVTEAMEEKVAEVRTVVGL